MFGSGILLIVIALMVVISLFIWYGKQYRLFETPANINRISRNATQAHAIYAKENPKRIGLRGYLNSLQKANVPASHLSVTNFYVSTVNATGVFYPAHNGVVSTEAVRAAVLAGARGFVFDIWPDLTPNAAFAPSIQVVEEGSLWRRISMNQLPLISILRALIQEAFETDGRPGHEDPIFIYLRFRGKPRSITYEATANVLQATLESYRLDASFNRGRGQDRIFSTPITQLFKKVVLFSNIRAEGTRLSDYINVAPSEGIKLDWNVADYKGLTADMRVEAVSKIKMNLSWVAPMSESKEAEMNSYDWKSAHDVGIQFAAMNFWNVNDAFKQYRGASLFEKQSFALKPFELRHVIELLPNPKQPVNPQWGAGPTAGTLRTPAAITMPKG